MRRWENKNKEGAFLIKLIKRLILPVGNHANETQHYRRANLGVNICSHHCAVAYMWRGQNKKITRVRQKRRGDETGVRKKRGLWEGGMVV